MQAPQRSPELVIAHLEFLKAKASGEECPANFRKILSQHSRAFSPKFSLTKLSKTMPTFNKGGSWIRPDGLIHTQQAQKHRPGDTLCLGSRKRGHHNNIGPALQKHLARSHEKTKPFSTTTTTTTTVGGGGGVAGPGVGVGGGANATAGGSLSRHDVSFGTTVRRPVVDDYMPAPVEAVIDAEESFRRNKDLEKQLADCVDDAPERGCGFSSVEPSSAGSSKISTDSFPCRNVFQFKRRPLIGDEEEEEEEDEISTSRSGFHSGVVCILTRGQLSHNSDHGLALMFVLV